MPVDTAKEAAKIVLDTSSGLGGLWQSLIGALGVGIAGLWGHVTGRLKKIEDNQVTAAALKEHIDDENEKFRTLFTKHDGISEKVADIAASVARIEGKLDR